MAPPPNQPPFDQTEARLAGHGQKKKAKNPQKMSPTVAEKHERVMARGDSS